MQRFESQINKCQTKSKYLWARPGFEPGTSRTLSENHTPRPTSPVATGQATMQEPLICDHVATNCPFWPNYSNWPCGPTDKASDYESGDCRFESCQGQNFFAKLKRLEKADTKKCAPPGGLEPPTFRLTAERASQLRHGGMWVSELIISCPIKSFSNFSKNFPTRMGFEPTRAEPIGLAVQRLNHSATSSYWWNEPRYFWW